VEVTDLRNADASAFPGHRLAGIGRIVRRNAGSITVADSAAYRAARGHTSGIAGGSASGSANAYRSANGTTPSVGNSNEVASPRRHEAGEAGHRGRADRRRTATLGVSPTVDFNNNAGG
jgi:hypothetical protein